MVTEKKYRGHRLRIKKTSEISIMIWPPGGGRAFNDIIYAPIDGSLDDALDEARALIDTELGD
jgi:hypothetical protein